MITTTSEMKKHLDLTNQSIYEFKEQRRKLEHRRSDLVSRQTGIQEKISLLNAELEALAMQMGDITEQIGVTDESLKHFEQIKTGIEAMLVTLEAKAAAVVPFPKKEAS